jgi:hypothetical protein
MTQVKRAVVRTRKGTPTKQAEGTIVGRKPGEITSLKGVFFGPPKTGKTSIACSGKNVLLISFDPDGDITETLQGRDDITVVEPTSFAEIDAIIRALHTTDAGRFDWVVVDSLTFLFQLLGGKELTEVFMANKDVRRAYGKAGAAVSQIIHDLVLLKDTNVIFTAHLAKESEEEVVSQDTRLGEHQVKLAVTPMVWKILGPAVSFIGRTYKQDKSVKGPDGKRNKQTVYAVSFNDGDRSPAGSRLPMQGEYESTGTTLSELATELLGG